MFTKLKNYKSFTDTIITLKDLYDIVIDNPQKSLIEEIRSVQYKSSEYDKLKWQVNAILPHGIFSGLTNDTLKQFSNYLFYDIDGIYTIDELNSVIYNLVKKFPISFLQRSVSNKGFHFLIKIDMLINNNIEFEYIYKYVRKLLIDEGFNIDTKANGISRKMIISSDQECIYNGKVSLGIDQVSFNMYKEYMENLNKVKTIQRQVERGDIGPNDTFEIIPFDQLTKEINTETIYTKEIDGDYIIEDMEYYRILIPQIIKDGTKHKLYTRIVNALYFINNGINIISRTQVFSYLYYINNRASPPMCPHQLKKYVTYLCDKIEEGGIRIKPRIKRIHFSKDTKLTKKQKQIMGAKIGGQIKTNKTLKLINDARMECAKRNIMPTQKTICEITGLSIATVKRNWNKHYTELNELEIILPDDNIIKENKLPEVDEDEFFNN